MSCLEKLVDNDFDFVQDYELLGAYEVRKPEKNETPGELHPVSRHHRAASDRFDVVARCEKAIELGPDPGERFGGGELDDFAERLEAGALHDHLARALKERGIDQLEQDLWELLKMSLGTTAGKAAGPNQVFKGWSQPGPSLESPRESAPGVVPR